MWPYDYTHRVIGRAEITFLRGRSFEAWNVALESNCKHRENKLFQAFSITFRIPRLEYKWVLIQVHITQYGDNAKSE